MSDDIEVQEEEFAPHESESARYLRVRREAKTRAAETVKANAEEAAKAKSKALAGNRRAKGVAAFEKRAKAIEARINSKGKSKE